jgi:restriction endonuclease
MISFKELCESEVDLVIDEIYEGGEVGNISDDVLTKLMNVQNAGGFRFRNILNSTDKAYIVLYSSNEDIDWPDVLEAETGKFKYYGDNKRPGDKVDSKKGNLILEAIFNETNRNRIPPIFVFMKNPTVSSNRSVKFLGLAVPEDYHLGKENSLKAIWRTSNGERFINYEAHFTILNTKSIDREWLICLINGDSLNSSFAPESWVKYVKYGLTDDIILRAPKNKEYRSKNEQLPSTNKELKKLDFIYQYYKDDPYKFEYFAAKLVGLMDNNFLNFNITRAVRDGGIDAIGEYRLGHKNNSIKLRCALEAKCYQRDNSNGVKLLSRLISRLKYRDFGIFVTTSYVSEQAYKELLEDGHPVIIISGKDIVEILTNNRINTEESLLNFMDTIDYL